MEPKWANRRGAVLAISLLVVIVIVTLSTIYVFRAVHENHMNQIQLNTVKSEYTLEAGANEGLEQLDTLINTNLMNKVNSTDPNVLVSNINNYVSNNTSINFIVTYTTNGATQLFSNVSGEAVYTGSSTTFDGGSFLYKIIVSAKGSPAVVSQNVWDFAYNYRIQVTANQDSVVQKAMLNGDFTVRVQKDNFARYALFTNSQTTTSGNNVWFTSLTNFSGPLFTNGTFNFAYNPSATFTDMTKQVGSTARFLNNGSPVLLNADKNGTKDVPNFQNGFTRGATAISMPTTTQESTMANEASGGNTYNSNGIYLPTSGSTLSGGIYVRGDADISLGVGTGNTSQITVTQGSSTKTITINYAQNQTTVVDQNNSTTVYSGTPNGVNDVGQIIYVKGNVNNLSGTVQKDTQLTIATQNDIVIQNNLRYEQYTASSGTPGQANYVPASAVGKTNLLGLLSWQGNVRIGSSAPNNVDIHATVMAKQGVFTVDNYDQGSPRGNANVLGGVISNNYGAFGTGSGSTALTGYGRNFVYDSRMESDYTPPYFPTMNTFIAFSDDINDKKFWQGGGF